MRRRAAVSCIAFVIAFAVAWLGGARCAAAAPVALTAEQWRADLHYLAEQMPLQHKNLYHTLTQNAFHQAVAQLDAEIPQLNDDQIALRLYAIAALPEDGHTGAQGYPGGTYFPLRIRHYPDGLYVESAPAKYAQVVGGRVVRIGAEPAEHVYQQLAALIPHDSGNPGLLEMIGPALMMSGAVLHGLGAEPSVSNLTVTIEKGGGESQLSLAPEVPFGDVFGHAPVNGWVDARGTAKPPLYLSHPDLRFWSNYDPANRMMYVQFNQVLDGKDETVEHFFNGVFKKAAEVPVDRFVLDLRMNDGGNNYLLKPIIVGLIRLTAIDQPGHLFVITSRNTYSAAQNLVNRLELYTSAIFVGQPTGEHVNSYGDPVTIELPNSHIRVGMASVWWQDTDERDKRIETDPELAADPTFADYVANRDPALEVIAYYAPGASLEDQMLAAVTRGGVPAGLAAYHAYAATPIHRYTVGRMERRLNALGYSLISSERLDAAVAILGVNAAANPNSANAADSLGEAYADAGDTAKAIASYKRALSLNPKLESSRSALAKLEAGH